MYRKFLHGSLYDSIYPRFSLLHIIGEDKKKTDTILFSSTVFFDLSTCIQRDAYYHLVLEKNAVRMRLCACTDDRSAVTVKMYIAKTAHQRYSSGSDSLQSTHSFTSFINVINLIFLLGEVNTFLIQVTCRLLASIITGQFLNKLCHIVTFIFLANHMTYLLFFIKILY